MNLKNNQQSFPYPIFYILFTLGLFSLNACHATNVEKDYSPDQYKNPVFEPVLADPTIIRDQDGCFYAFGTEDTWNNKDHLIAIIQSHDLVNWSYVNDAFTSKPTWKTDGGGLWAPDIHYSNGTYYLFYAYSLWGDTNPGIGLAVSNSPKGPFIDQGKVFTSNEIGVENSIDPYFIEDNGHNYLFWGSFRGIFGIELSSDCKSVIGQKFQIAGNFFEGSYILKRNNYYYYFGSTGSCCNGAQSTYQVTVARATSIGGPYLNKSGVDILNEPGSLFIQGNNSFAGPGHNAPIITDDKGDDWFIYHAIDRKIPFLSGKATRRPLMIDKISWNNGWPEIKDNHPSSLSPKPFFKSI